GEDEMDADGTVSYRRKVEVERIGRLAGALGVDDSDRARVDVRERLEQSLGVAGRHASSASGGVDEMRMTGLVNFHWSVPATDVEEIRVFLAPLERRLRAVDANGQPILLAERDLRGEENALGAALVAHEHIRIVVDAPAGNHGAHLGEQFRHLQSGDVA